MTTRSKLYGIFAIGGVLCYVTALLAVSLLWPDFSLKPLWIAWGLLAVLSFFLSTWTFHNLTTQMQERKFLLTVFITALVIRAVYVVAIGYYYYFQTGSSFEYDAADSCAYNDLAKYLAWCVKQGHPLYAYQYLCNAVYPMGFSDQGYTMWLTLLYTIFGTNLLIPRLLKALMGAYICVAIYKLASRCCDNRTARLAAVICVFFPTLIHYTGLHLKEIEMLFVTVMAIERTDYVIRSKKYTFLNITAVVFFTIMIFGFRTVLGMAVLFSYFVFAITAPDNVIGKRTKIIVAVTITLVAVVFAITFIGNEMCHVVRLRTKTTDLLVEKYAKEGLEHAEYARNIYLAPGTFVLPLTNMVEVANTSQKMMNGSTFVKNLLAVFVMLSFVTMVRRKEWRGMSLITAFVLAYAGIIAMSFFVTSERYHFPLLPFYAILAAYSMTHFRRKEFPVFYTYCALLIVAIVVWNFLKLSARGLV